MSFGRWVAAAAAALSVAASAKAEIMDAHLRGTFNGGDWYSADLWITYDTSLGTLSPIPGGDQLTWNSSVGTPSPGIAAHLLLTARYPPEYGVSYVPASRHFNFYDFDSFSIERTPSKYYFGFVSGDVSLLYTGWESFFGPLGDAPGTVFSVLAPYESSRYRSDYASWSGVGVSGPAIDTISVKRHMAGVPEPATWATLVMGFMALGALTRRRRVAAAMPA